MELYKSPIVFYDVDNAHQYFSPSGEEISGVTGMISRQLFPDKYDGIPKSILANAAARGDLIHRECEQYDKVGILGDTKEVAAYAKLKEQVNIRAIANEYIVSDEQHFATKTDLVAQIGDCPEDMVDLCDHKTTYSVDKEYLSWQLSINAVFFELFNTVKVNKLYGIWLRGENAKLIEIPRKPDEYIWLLIQCELEGSMYPLEVSELPAEASSMLARLSVIEAAIVEVESQAAESKKLKENLVKELYAAMEKHSVSKWETDNIVVTRVAPTSSVGVDTAKFKKDFPDIYAKCTKTTNKSGFLKIKIKEDDKDELD